MYVYPEHICVKSTIWFKQMIFKKENTVGLISCCLTSVVVGVNGVLGCDAGTTD